MELVLYNPQEHQQPANTLLTVAANNIQIAASRSPFIEANTVEGSLTELRHHHIIPVFARDNEPLISQVDFIEVAEEVVHSTFPAERILSPFIRLSHPIKGRVPEARNKPASELMEHEKTIYYERMAFIIEVPTIADTIDGERLSLTIGGVKAYNLDNLGGRRGTEEHFKIFIGFKVSVCTNLCVWSDGFTYDIRVKSLEQLKLAIFHLVSSFDAIAQLKKMEALQRYSLTEQQFAQLIGRCRMYQHLPAGLKQGIPQMQFGDAQINAVCRDYYRDQSFCRDAGGDISLWRLYNLLTAANKQSYIDTFLDRAVNASTFTSELASALEHKGCN
ncbi:DUF3871 family protein [Paracnuella aquatica]|uniref:DUF3871 family protein n=1 Tax=Paracnuella aquatica TaxID=2268757 RepID=UPI000DEF1036|nr:DUF3871 family protein [Paracnuella aquatica]RPD51149.1 DUF3871 family protein [Paracnuella aquatica]